MAWLGLDGRRGHCSRRHFGSREPPGQAPLAYTPPYLAEKILTSRSALEGERKQVTVLFADLKGSTELIRDFDPEQAQALLDPALHAMMDAVHRFEGTVNQVLGDGIMALFGAPIAHEDHALRACYAALAMQAAMRAYTDEVRRTRGLPVQMRVGLHSGDVVVRTIANDLHMDYSAVGLTTRPSGAHGATRYARQHAADRRHPAPGGRPGAGLPPGCTLHASWRGFLHFIWRSEMVMLSQSPALSCGVHHFTCDRFQRVDLHEAGDLRHEPVEQSEVAAGHTDNRRARPFINHAFLR